MSTTTGGKKASTFTTPALSTGRLLVVPPNGLRVTPSYASTILGIHIGMMTCCIRRASTTLALQRCSRALYLGVMLALFCKQEKLYNIYMLRGARLYVTLHALIPYPPCVVTLDMHVHQALPDRQTDR